MYDSESENSGSDDPGNSMLKTMTTDSNTSSDDSMSSMSCDEAACSSSELDDDWKPSYKKKSTRLKSSWIFSVHSTLGFSMTDYIKYLIYIVHLASTSSIFTTIVLLS